HVLWRQGRPGEPGTFAPPLLVNPGRPAHDAVTLTGNGPPLVAAIDAGGATVSLYQYFPGGFRFYGTLPTGALPSEIESADLNGDGHGDLVVRNAGSGTLTVYLGLGHETFTRLAEVPVGTDASSVALADADGDGRLDLLVTDRFSGDVQVWHNRGN